MVLVDHAFLQVFEMPEHHTGQLGGTMRLGSKKTEFVTENSVIS